MSKQKIVILHGLFCNGWIMHWLGKQLNQLGYHAISLSYPTLKQSVIDGAKQLEQQIRDFKGEDTLYFVGHSMGGLMIRYLQNLYPDLFENSRVVTLGTPHNGSQFAKHIHEKWPAFVLGKSWVGSLDGNVPAWNPMIPLLSIAGTKSGLENKVVRVFSKDQVNDSLVLLTETQIPEMQDFKTIHRVHMKLIFDSTVVTWIDEWFKKN